jgi:hypothetical protein
VHSVAVPLPRALSRRSRAVGRVCPGARAAERARQSRQQQRQCGWAGCSCGPEASRRRCEFEPLVSELFSSHNQHPLPPPPPPPFPMYSPTMLCNSERFFVDGDTFPLMSDAELAKYKSLMEEDFRKNQLKPGDAGFEYDKQVQTHCH